MDHIHCIAAQRISTSRKSEAEDVDAFYSAYAFAGFHTCRKAVKATFASLRAGRDLLMRKVVVALKIALALQRT
ncbi:MAG: hypothetical protein HKN63_03160 [Rhodobacteraceae bacterium]|nr:hypothetical protein [Paracoccaceae bacterium]